MYDEKQEYAFKRSFEEGHEPNRGDLVPGELGIGLKENALFTKDRKSNRITKINKATGISTKGRRFPNDVKNVATLIDALTILAGGIILRPNFISPVSGADNVHFQPTLEATGYRNINKTPRLHRVFEIVKAEDNFSSPVFQVSINSDFVKVDMFQLPTKTPLKWRCRDEDIDGVLSDWSIPQYFRLMEVGIRRPSVGVDQDFNALPADPSFFVSVFSVINGEDEYKATDWMIKKGEEVVWQLLGEPQNSIDLPAGILEQGTTYTVYARHVGVGFGEGEWGELMVTTKARFFLPPFISWPENGAQGFNGSLRADWGDSSRIPTEVKWELAADAAFTEIVAGYSGLDKITVWKPQFNLVNYNGRAVYARLSHKISGSWTEWSVPVVYTLPVIKVTNPEVEISGDINNLIETPVLATTPFAIENAEDDHASTEWRILDSEGNELQTFRFTQDGYKTVLEVPTGILEQGQQYEFQVRHTSTNFGSSEWVSISGTTKAFFVEPFASSLYLDEEKYANITLNSDFEGEEVNWEGATDSDFSNPFASYTGTKNWVKYSPKPDYISFAGETIFIRVRYRKGTYWSDWRWISYTMESISVNTPTLEIVGGSEEVGGNPYVLLSDFSVNYGDDIHISTSFELLDQYGEVIWSEEDLTNQYLKNESPIPGSFLKENSVFTIRARYNGLTHGSSEWASISFRTKSDFSLEIPLLGNPDLAGMPYAGGYYAGGNIIVDGRVYAVVVASKVLGGQTSKIWKDIYTTSEDTSSPYNGRFNQESALKDPLSSHPAFEFCDNLILNGYNDWHLPSRDELEIVYFYLRPHRNNNRNDMGFRNYNALPDSKERDLSHTENHPLFVGGRGYESFGVDDVFWTGSQNFKKASVNTINLGRGIYYSYSPETEFEVRAVRWEYLGKVRVPIAQPMTTYEEFDQIVTASSNYGSSYRPYHVFNREFEHYSDEWISRSGSRPTPENPEWVAIEFLEPRSAQGYRITAGEGNHGHYRYFPSWWRVEASNDGENWDLLHEYQLENSNRDVWKTWEFDFDGTVSYSNYRLVCAHIHDVSGWVSVSRFDILNMPED